MTHWYLDRQPQRPSPSVSLRRLLPDARFLGCEDFQASGCTADSRRLDPGQVYVAVRGSRVDGHEFVGQAVERGAAGVVVEHPQPRTGRPQMVVPNSRVAHARLCQALAGDPSHRLSAVGVAGARGRGPASAFALAILDAAGSAFGRVGRVDWWDGREARPSGPGSPPAEALAAMLAAMVDRGCDGALIEFDADALDRRRADGVRFDAAVVTDLSGPPGEDPRAAVGRRSAAARLVRLVEPGGLAVVNADDPQAELLGAVNLDARRVAYSVVNPDARRVAQGAAPNRDAEVTAVVERAGRDGTRFRLRGFDREVVVNLRVAGHAAVGHALAAAALAWGRGVEVGAVAAGLESVTPAPGRLRRVAGRAGVDLRVGPAACAAGLAEAVGGLAAVTAGKIHCVLGGEGSAPDARLDRRAVAGAVEALAHRVTLTTADPRGEDPDRILDDLLAGFRRLGRVRVEPDRRLAIASALAEAEPGDAVLIAGEGRQGVPAEADPAFPSDADSAARDALHVRADRSPASKTR